ncbi:hypothetical protein Ancab_031172 [Ancistrocladus abbreviatus]
MFTLPDNDQSSSKGLRTATSPPAEHRQQRMVGWETPAEKLVKENLQDAQNYHNILLTNVAANRRLLGHQRSCEHKGISDLRSPGVLRPLGQVKPAGQWLTGVDKGSFVLRHHRSCEHGQITEFIVLRVSLGQSDN